MANSVDPSKEAAQSAEDALDRLYDNMPRYNQEKTNSLFTQIKEFLHAAERKLPWQKTIDASRKQRED